MEIGPELVVPVDKDMVRDREAFIEAMNRAIIYGGFYKNALEMVELPRRYVEEPRQFKPMFEKDEFRQMINSPPVITESLERVYVRSNGYDRGRNFGNVEEQSRG